MSSWQDEQLHALLSIRCERKLLDAIAAIARSLEFEHFSYGMRIPVPITRPQVRIFSNYPLLWHELYRERNYVSVDPTVRHGMRSLLPSCGPMICLLRRMSCGKRRARSDCMWAGRSRVAMRTVSADC